MSNVAKALLLAAVVAISGPHSGSASARPASATVNHDGGGALSRAVEAAIRARVKGDSRVTIRQLIPPPDAGRIGRNPTLSLVSQVLASGWLTFRAAHPKGDVWVRAEVEVDVPTVVAVRELPRGATVTPDVVTIDWRPLSDRSVTDLDAAIGTVTRQRFAAGEAIGNWALDRPVAIERGDRVTASLVGSGYAITVEAEALARGRVGDTIDVRTRTGSPASLRAVVTGPRQVEVR
jgi:flagella basal body P-ring formation protein FlgA